MHRVYREVAEWAWGGLPLCTDLPGALQDRSDLVLAKNPRTAIQELWGLPGLSNLSAAASSEALWSWWSQLNQQEVIDNLFLVQLG